MRSVISLDSLYVELDAVKRQAVAMQTNLFIDRAQIQRWIEGGALEITIEADMLLLFRHDRNFEHLYYWGNAQSLPHTLADFARYTQKTTVTDLIHREGDIATAAVFQKAGFEPYTQLCRMVRAGVPDSETGDDNNIRPAHSDEATVVLAALEAIFDRFAENLPTMEEISMAAEDGRLLVISRGDELVGGLLFDQCGVTAHMRYCWVDPRLHGQGLGSALIRRYHAMCPQVRRFVLWVQSDNRPAIALYRRFGYSFDGLQDSILRWERRTHE